jgi:Protein of unknown function (DUF3012)
MRTISANASKLAAALAALYALSSLTGCAPKVGSERWCANMRDKPRGDWTANEAVDYARHCIVN